MFQGGRKGKLPTNFTKLTTNLIIKLDIWSMIIRGKRMYTCMCNWVTMLYSRKKNASEITIKNFFKGYDLLSEMETTV